MRLFYHKIDTIIKVFQTQEKSISEMFKITGINTNQFGFNDKKILREQKFLNISDGISSQ